MRLLFDEHYAEEIAEQLRSAGHDADSVSARGLKGLDDEPLLELCQRESRALMTTTCVTSCRWRGRGRRPGRDHAGHVALLAALMAANPAERPLSNDVRWLG